MSKPQMWKAPARREYKPKDMDPGQVIVWSVTIPGYWTIPAHMDGDTYTGPAGTWIPEDRYERIGTIWSVATSPNSWWVTPDDDMGNPVVVRRQGKKFSLDRREGELYETREHLGWRDALRRAENVRKRGIFAVVEGERQPWGYSRYDYGKREMDKVISWHADTDCPLAEGKPRDDGSGYSPDRSGPGYGDWNALTAADVLIGRTNHQVPSSFCKHCIMLEPQPEPVRELVTA
jgi:hypothetical protein